MKSGCLAQLGEHRLYTARVGGSIPSTSTIIVLHADSGGIAKWPNAADCKSVPNGSVVQIRLPPPFDWGIAKR